MPPSNRRRHRSCVGDVIKFDPEENPPWRVDGQTVPPVSDMVQDIVGFQNEWESMKGNCDASAVQREFLEKFVFCNNARMSGDHYGCRTLEETRECLASEHEGSSELTTEQQATWDLKMAYEYLLDTCIEEKGLKNKGNIEESMLRGAHEIILKSAKTPPGCTAPGLFCNGIRGTDYKGKYYEYENPPDMDFAVVELLNKFNSLFNQIMEQGTDDQTQHRTPAMDNMMDMDKRLLKLYKACSWLLFRLLNLHPFGDGNGRLCRLLCSYVLSTCTPFPTPIYNVCSTPHIHMIEHYLDAIVQTRESDSRHPKALATMIIECSWYGWKEFLSRVKTLNEGHAEPRPT